MNRLTENRFAIPLLAALVAMSFARTTSNGFTYDDFSVLVNNPGVTGDISIARLISDPSAHATGDVVLSYRPLRSFLLSIEYRLFGENPAPYHVVNLLFHFGVCLLARSLLRRVIGEPLATLAAAIHAVHPLTVEVVASVKAQDDLLAAASILGSSILFRRALTGEERSASTWTALGIVVALGFLAKENAVAIPALLALVWIVTPSTERGLAPKAAWVAIGGAAVLAGAFLIVRARLVEAAEATSTLPLGELLPTVVHHLPRYARLFLWPDPLLVDYSHLSRLSWSSGAWVLSALAQALVALAVVRFGNWPMRFGLGWFYLALLPHLDPRTYFVFGERFAYVPSLGLAVFTLGTAVRFVSGPRARRETIVTAIGLALLAPLAWRSARRGLDWRSNETLFSAQLDARPDATIVRGFLVSDLVARGETEEARRILAEGPALTIRPPRSSRERRALSDLALIALREAKWSEAARVLREVTRSPLARTGDWMNLGTALTNLGEHDEARSAFRAVLERDPSNAGAERMLGRIALEESDPDTALRHFDRARAFEPDHALGQYFALFALWKSAGDEAALERLVELEALGVSIGTIAKEDRASWASAGSELRAALEALGD